MILILGSSVVELSTVNRAVVGSNPTPGVAEDLRHRYTANPKAVGERSEVFVFAALVRAGYEVLIAPFSDNQRYDLVLDLDDCFARVQVKTGRLIDGSIVFATSSSQAHRGRGRQNYRGQCELFAVYCPVLDKTYIIPVDAVPAAECSLRVDPSRNKQHRRVRWAADYELRPRQAEPIRLIADAGKHRDEPDGA